MPKERKYRGDSDYIFVRRKAKLAQSDTSSIYTQLVRWLQANHALPDGEFYFSDGTATTLNVLRYIDVPFDLGNDWQYESYDSVPCSLVPSITSIAEDQLGTRTGAMRYHFRHRESGAQCHALAVTVPLHDADLMLVFRSLAYVPKERVPQWIAFEKECKRIENSAVQFRGKVSVVGGTENTFASNITLDDVFLPHTLKSEIVRDIDAFFQRGVYIYKRLNIKPFRKLLLAGLPGTGKTMLCSALANWATQQAFFVAYVSGSSTFGARFWKIHQALEMAASSSTRAFVIVEELDAYLQDDESMAEMLNVLDGLETPSNPFGTLLIATTNHPQKIDERVLKRPGRLDRVFVVPEMNDRESVERMLRNYIGDAWRDEHLAIVDELLGKPGAFIREMVLYALTVSAYQDEELLTLGHLQESARLLAQQLDAKDDFLTRHKQEDIGFSATTKRSKRAQDVPF